MLCDELKDKWFNAYPEIMGIEGGEPTKCYGKSEVDEAIEELKAKADKLHSCLKCLVMRDLIKDCSEKKSAIEIVKEYK